MEAITTAGPLTTAEEHKTGEEVEETKLTEAEEVARIQEELNKRIDIGDDI